MTVELRPIYFGDLYLIHLEYFNKTTLSRCVFIAKVYVFYKI